MRYVPEFDAVRRICYKRSIPLPASVGPFFLKIFQRGLDSSHEWVTLPDSLARIGLR